MVGCSIEVVNGVVLSLPSFFVAVLSLLSLLLSQLLLLVCCGCCFIAGAVTSAVQLLLLLLLLLLFCCCSVVVVMKGEANNWNDFRANSKGAVLFPIVKLIVFLFFSFKVCMNVSSTTLYNAGLSNFGTFLFLGANIWINKLSTSRSTIGPHVGSNS